MSTKFTTALALAAGFIGGLVSHYCAPSAVRAQEKASIPQEIQAHKFVLVDENGIARGVFGHDKDGRPGIQLMDVKGHKWVFREFRPLGKKYDMLPDLPRSSSKSK